MNKQGGGAAGDWHCEKQGADQGGNAEAGENFERGVEAGEGGGDGRGVQAAAAQTSEISPQAGASEL